MAERLQEIKSTFERKYLRYEDVSWLIAEVERLREDWEEVVELRGELVNCRKAYDEVRAALAAAVSVNPKLAAKNDRQALLIDEALLRVTAMRQNRDHWMRRAAALGDEDAKRGLATGGNV